MAEEQEMMLMISVSIMAMDTVHDLTRLLTRSTCRVNDGYEQVIWVQISCSVSQEISSLAKDKKIQKP